MSSVVLHETFRKFVELAKKFQGTSWMDVDARERDATILEILRMVGFEVHHVEPKGLLGYFKDQDGSCSGEPYLVNSACPMMVVSRRWVTFDVQEVADDYRATTWLNDTVWEVSRLLEDEAIIKLASLVAQSMPMPPIRLTSFGDTMVEPSSSDSHIREDDKIWKKQVVHGGCMGTLQLHRCSDEWRSISCCKCGFHIYVPSNLNTFNELRKNIRRVRLGD